MKKKYLFKNGSSFPSVIDISYAFTKVNDNFEQPTMTIKGVHPTVVKVD
jgi:hypothetical protein